MNSKEVNLSEIKSNPNNPRIIRDDKFYKLVESIKTFPRMLEIRPIVVNKDMVVLGGNMRLKACKEAGIKKVPVIFADDLTDEQQREFIIKDNVGFGEWDWAMLANEWDANELQDWGLDIPDFETKQLEAVEDDYEIPDEIQTDIVIGDLFEIGEHRLLCGDCTDILQIEKLAGGNKFDAVITDPPYGISVDKEMHKKSGEKYGNAKAKKGKYRETNWDNQPIDKTQIDLIISMAKSVIIWGGNYFEVPPTRCYLVWDKDNSTNNFADCELAWTNLDKPVRLKKHLWNGMLRAGKEERYNHPTQKPVGIIAWCIGFLEKNDKLILDLYLGSGTTMVAAHQLNKVCYGMELDPKYCQVIIDRMRKLDPSLKVKRNGIEI